MTAPPWPDVPPTSGPVVVRAFEPTDLPMALELVTDPWAPSIGTMPASATEAEAADWIGHQPNRWA
jgi:ribosomal-protein-alanine N-acetyltransferase